MIQSDRWWTVSEQVEDALAQGVAVVALESTVIAHGLPRPRNLRVARQLEAAVREAGAVPATIAVIDGDVRVGLGVDEIERIATDQTVAKLSTRDLPVAMGRGDTGATTVAATSRIAHAAGIEVFATGGIGGVHRGERFDVSADLSELQRTPIVVVCSGAKSILDLVATREALETLGVLVLGWRTDRFPAFYTEASDLTVDARVDSIPEVAAIRAAHRRGGAVGAMLLAVPVPSAAAVSGERLETALADALAEAEDGGIRGKEVTPFLMGRIAAATGGDALEANVALLLNNATVAAKVAVALSGQ